LRTSLRRLCVSLALLPALAMAASGTESAGVLKRVSGDVLLQRGSMVQAAAVGQRVQVGDVIRTGANGSASVTLSDDTLLSSGPGSELVITQFNFNPTTHDGGLLLSLWRGTLSVVTGLIARKSPDTVKVQTRTVVLGVRGTEFIVDAAEGP
jgi:hypothetical protein